MPQSPLFEVSEHYVRRPIAEVRLTALSYTKSFAHPNYDILNRNSHSLPTKEHPIGPPPIEIGHIQGTYKMQGCREEETPV